ncbi:hypothetical protein BC939DRAFT_78629 [Gamsiella multidivaricata]|uniref:uncharacterized protein n=1 Tax=Gamsiella multidivaricata TaxID=101098 RepID=UPI00221FCB09|nr:uncharacterized protein BC939DRAFT_78629 [Gamsiella multidivaricata]KAI7828065.1 hypothetical protein BC939DRAFT_78629 [Gamsiella multidivaricata]
MPKEDGIPVISSTPTGIARTFPITHKRTSPPPPPHPTMVRFFVGLAALASVAFADITFNCIGYPSKTGGAFGVSISGAITKLATNETTFPVWSGVVPGTTSAVQYSYVELDATGAAVKTEAFARKLNQTTDTSTDNEFFDRPITYHEIVRLPYTYLATYPSKSKAFKEDQIATIHLTAPAATIQAMNAAPETEADVKVTFRFINAKTIYTQNNITLKTSGKSSKEFAKQSYKFKFDTDYNQTFFSRPNLKLRSMSTEPTYLREKLYIDMLNSVGVPTQQVNMHEFAWALFCPVLSIFITDALHRCNVYNRDHMFVCSSTTSRTVCS